MSNSTSNAFIAGHPVQPSFDSMTLTTGVGTEATLKYVRRYGLLNSFAGVLEDFVPRRRKGGFKFGHHEILEQFTAMILKGLPAFTDAKILDSDPILAETLQIASSPTLSRYFARLDLFCESERKRKLDDDTASVEQLDKTDPIRICSTLTDQLNMALLQGAIDALKLSTESTEFLTVDVDSTPVQTYGLQKETAFDGHYCVKGYLPIFVTVNGLPAFVQNAPGAANGASLFLLHVDKILNALHQAFPKATIIVRADTGFSKNELLERIHSMGHKFVIGSNHCGGRHIRPEAMEVLRSVVNKHADLLPTALERFANNPDYDPTNDEDCKSVRVCGKVDYKAASWSFDRHVVYRLNIDPQHNRPNFRFIQTNLQTEDLLAYTQGRGVEKARAENPENFGPEADKYTYAVELYDAAFSDRGMDERLNQEWKTQCFASRVSCSGFFANSVRMILSALAYQIIERIRRTHLKLFERPAKRSKRNSQKPNVTRSHQAEKILCGPSINTFRAMLFNLPSRIIKKRDNTLKLVMGYVPKPWQKLLLELLAL